MIVSWTDDWAMLTPTKCGSRSAEKALDAVSYVVTPRHRIHRIDGCTRRYMLVREWRDRFVSIHRYLQRSPRYFGQRVVPEDPNEFVDAFFANWARGFRQDYFPPLFLYYAQWQPHEVLRLEDVSSARELLGQPFPRLNATRERETVEHYFERLSRSRRRRLESHYVNDERTWYSESVERE